MALNLRNPLAPNPAPVGGVPTAKPAVYGQPGVPTPNPAPMTGMGLVQLARTDPTMGQVQPVTPMPQAAPTVGPQPTVQLPVTTPNSVVARAPAVPQVGAGPESVAFDANAELQRQRMNRPLNPNQPMRKTRNGAM